MLAHGPEQLCARRTERMPRFFAQGRLEFFSRRQGGAIFLDKASQRRAIAFAAQAAGQKRQMDIPARLIPRAKCSGGHVLLDAFGRPTLESKLPVMNRSSAV